MYAVDFRQSHRISILVILVITFLGLGLRLTAVQQKSILYHDDAISLMTAAAKAGTYDDATRLRTFPVDSLSTVQDWQIFFVPNLIGSFERISADLTQYDIHPPLFFWLLHLWNSLIELDFLAVHLLNFIIFLLASLGLILLARATFSSPHLRLLSYCIWMLSPATLLVSINVRQYELLAGITIWSAYILLRIQQRGAFRFIHLTALFILSLAGGLTHYIFFVIWFVLILSFSLQRQQLSRHTILTAITSAASGVFSSLIIFPPSALLRLSDGPVNSTLSWGLEFVARVLLVFKAFTFFVTAQGTIQLILSLACISFLFWLLMRKSRHKWIIDYWNKLDEPHRFLLLVCLGLMGAFVILHLLQITPRHAMSPVHLSPIWPFAAIVLASVVGSLLKLDLARISILLFVMFGFSFQHLVQLRQTEMPPWSDYEMIVTDTTARGVLPTFMLSAPSTTAVYNGLQSKLIDEFELWSSSLPSRFIFVTNPRDTTSSEEGRRKLFELFRARGMQMELIFVTPSGATIYRGTSQVEGNNP